MNVCEYDTYRHNICIYIYRYDFVTEASEARPKDQKMQVIDKKMNKIVGATINPVLTRDIKNKRRKNVPKGTYDTYRKNVPKGTYDTYRHNICIYIYIQI